MQYKTMSFVASNTSAIAMYSAILPCTVKHRLVSEQYSMLLQLETAVLKHELMQDE